MAPLKLQWLHLDQEGVYPAVLQALVPQACTCKNRNKLVVKQVKSTPFWSRKSMVETKHASGRGI